MKLIEVLNLAQVPSILIMGAVYMAYVLIGGVIFWKLEGNLGREDVSAILARKQQVLKSYECLNSDGIDVVIQVRRPSIEASVICDVLLLLLVAGGYIFMFDSCHLNSLKLTMTRGSSLRQKTPVVDRGLGRGGGDVSGSGQDKEIVGGGCSL